MSPIEIAALIILAIILIGLGFIVIDERKNPGISPHPWASLTNQNRSKDDEQ